MSNRINNNKPVAKTLGWLQAPCEIIVASTTSLHNRLANHGDTLVISKRLVFDDGTICPKCKHKKVTVIRLVESTVIRVKFLAIECEDCGRVYSKDGYLAKI